MLVVDTNVLVYAADEDSPFHAACRRWLEAQCVRAEVWYTTWGILYEFLRVTTHPRVMRRPWGVTEAWGFVEALLGAPGLDILVAGDRHREIAGRVVEEMPHLTGNLIHDAHTAILMREHGIRRICTRDTDFHRFAFVEVFDPVQA